MFYINLFNYLREGICFKPGAKIKLIVLTMALSVVLLLINHFFLGYHGANYVVPQMVVALPCALFFLIAAQVIRSQHPRFSLFFDTLGKLSFVALTIMILSTAAQYTPFPRFDLFFYHFDQAIGVNTVKIMQWAQSIPPVYYLSEVVYFLLLQELFLAPLILAFLFEKRQIDVFFIACLLSALIGFLIYYFIPTTDPAAVVKNANFTLLERAVLTQYNILHNHGHLTNGIAFVSFPSFHVIWATIVTYVFRNRKYLLYPMILLNVLVVISTLTLGWHYFADILGGFLVAGVSIYVAEKWSKVADTAAPRLSFSLTHFIHLYPTACRGNRQAVEFPTQAKSN